MKRLMTMVAIALTVALTGSAFAATGDRVVTKYSVATSADTLVFTNTITLAYGSVYRAIERVQVVNNSTSTLTSSVVTLADNGVFSTFATYALATTVSTNDYPLRAGVWVDVSTTNTPPTMFVTQKLRVITTLAATNAVVSSIDFVIFGKE